MSYGHNLPTTGVIQGEENAKNGCEEVDLVEESEPPVDPQKR